MKNNIEDYSAMLFLNFRARVMNEKYHRDEIWGFDGTYASEYIAE